MNKSDSVEYINHIEGILRNVAYTSSQLHEEGLAWTTLGFDERAKRCYDNAQSLSYCVDSVNNLLTYFK